MGANCGIAQLSKFPKGTQNKQKPHTSPRESHQRSCYIPFSLDLKHTYLCSFSSKKRKLTSPRTLVQNEIKSAIMILSSIPPQLQGNELRASNQQSFTMQTPFVYSLYKLIYSFRSIKLSIKNEFFYDSNTFINFSEVKYTKPKEATKTS